MKWLAIVVGVAACTPCEGQRNVTDGYVAQAQLQPELAKCAGQRVCLDPCQDLLAWTPDQDLLACKVTLDSTGGGQLQATYIDYSVCSGDESIDTGGGVYVDTGSSDDGSDDSPPPDDGSDDPAPPDDGSDDSTPPDDGTPDDGSSDLVAPGHHGWTTAQRAQR